MSKLHIWNLTPAFPDKVNFVDSNNVILGYDLNQCCCEHAFWTIGNTPDGTDIILKGDDNENKEISLVGYVFDPEYFQVIEDEGEEKYVAVFRLVARANRKEDKELFIRLENHHNGYYSHGFVFRAKTVREGGL